MTNVVLYPGSFDPVTKGHMALIEQACLLFDRVVVAIAINTQKKAYFSLDQRLKMLAVAVGENSAVEVVSFDGLTVDFAQEIGAIGILRGLRMASDFEYEFQLAGMNHDLAPSIQTCFLPAMGKYSHISSSMTREILELGGDITPFVDARVLALIRGL